MKTYSREEIDMLIAEGHTGDYHLVIHAQDLIKLAHAIAYNAQSSNVNGMTPLSENWKTTVEKHLVKVFSTYLKQEKIHIIKSRDEDA
jgi:hypothetical protein